jgi:ribonuclease III
VPAPRAAAALGEQEARVLAEFGRHYGVPFRNLALLRLALTHRSYLHVTGQGPRDSNERLEFLGDSVLGLVTSEFLYRAHPTEHEGQLTKTKSLLVSKAILSRRALAMGLGRFVLMSHSEVESGGRQRLSILADAFESVVGAIYLDQGFEAARAFIEHWLLRDSRVIVADKRHTNYKSHLQEYVQSSFRTHPVYRIRSEMGPDHSKQFMVEVIVGRRVLGSGKGRNKKEAEQAAARNALEQVGDRSGDRGETRGAAAAESARRGGRGPAPAAIEPPAADRLRGGSRRTGAATIEPPRTGGATPPTSEPPEPEIEEVSSEYGGRRRRGRRGGRGRRGAAEREPEPAAAPPSERVTLPPPPAARAIPPPRGEREAPGRREPRPQVQVEAPARFELEPPPRAHEEDENEEVGRPEGRLEERHVDPYAWGSPAIHEPPRAARPPAPPVRSTEAQLTEHAAAEDDEVTDSEIVVSTPEITLRDRVLEIEPPGSQEEEAGEEIVEGSEEIVEASEPLEAPEPIAPGPPARDDARQPAAPRYGRRRERGRR